MIHNKLAREAIKSLRETAAEALKKANALQDLLDSLDQTELPFAELNAKPAPASPSTKYAEPGCQA